MKTYRTSDSVLRFVRFSALIVSVAIIAAASYSASSASSSLFASGGSLPKSTSTSNPGGMLGVANGSINATTAYSLITEKGGGGKFGLGATGLYPALVFQALPPESIATFLATDCATPKTDFILNEEVCAKATGVPSLLFPYRVSWVSPEGLIVKSETASTNPNTQYTYSPTTAGTWRVNLTKSSGVVRQSAVFTVHDTANVSADVFVQKFARAGDNTVPSGNNIAFTIVVGNNGPDTAVNVHLVDSAPSGFTVFSFTQQSGPSCLPAGAGDCAIASMANGDRAEFTAIYNSGGNAQGSYPTSATVSSDTADSDNSNNTSTSEVIITAASGGGTCDLTCPTNITTDANTTEGGLRGAHVTFDDAAGTGTCGSVSSSPASGSFFPVGTTPVHATSETGGGTCTFTVTVEDPSGNTTISCPANQTANADSNCEATVSVGTPTATGDNVTVSGVRSDGKPMYNCDCFTPDPNDPTVACDIHGACTRKADAPFAAGVTTITWTAYSHDIAGPYASPVDEEAHRTGNASCTQTITVNDITPPTIIAPPGQTASADANCLAPVPDFTTSATVSDNCACSSSDTSESCVDREILTVTQSPAPGTMVGLGPHTITLTANDGSSNNNGAGNTATEQTTFTVNDTTAPIITCPANITRSNDPGQCSASINPGTATATDNCDSNPTVSGTRSDNQPLNAPYPVGTTTITWTAIDHTGSPGNLSSCNQTVTVNDTELPTISCPNSITLEPTCPSGAIATYTTPVGMDNCPGAITTRTAGLASGSVFTIGTTTVTYSVTDAHGNGPVSCSFTVTVLTPQAVIQNLVTSVSNSSLTGTQKNGLLAKLNAALDGINQGKTNVACNKLDDFINSVQTLVDHGDITSAQGTSWIDSANHVRNTIGCTNNPCT